jgi:hypothetical protein
MEKPFWNSLPLKLKTYYMGYFLKEKKHDSLDTIDIPCEPCDDRYVMYERVEEVKLLSDNIEEPLLDFDNCSLNKFINILQSFANDPSFNVHQTSFGSYIANHVFKEKIQRYNNEAMVPPKLGDVWITKIFIFIGKESHHAILDLDQAWTFPPKNYMIYLILIRN